MNIRRFYRKELPDVDDVVIMKISREDEYGYYGNLLEYENVEGFVALSEIIKGRYMKKKHPFKLGDLHPFTVIKINSDKNTVDVSRKRTEDDDAEDTLIQYRICGNINKLVNEFYTMYLSYYQTNYIDDELYDINDIMDKTIWNIYNDDELNYQEIYNKILGNPLILLPDSIFHKSFIEKAIENVNSRIIKKNMIIEMEINLIVVEDDAINKIKDIFDIEHIQIPEDYKVQITLQTTPIYKIKIEGQNKDYIDNIFNDLKKSIIEKTKKYNCLMSLKEPKIVSDTIYEIKFISDNDLKKIKL